MRYDIMKAAFDDELEKIAVSHPWVKKHVSSAVNKGAKTDSVQAFANRMGNKATKLRYSGGNKARVRDLADTAKRTAESKLGDRRVSEHLKKEAGSMQGHVRSGRRPLTATTLLRKEKEDEKGSRKKLADMTKMSGKTDIGSKLMPDAKTLGLLGIGAYGMHRLQKMNRRYQTGRQIEFQQQQGY